MPIRSEEYWKERFDNLHQRLYKNADDYEEELVKFFKDASRDIKKTVNQYYAEYGVIQNTPIFETLEDGTQIVTGNTSKLAMNRSFIDSNRFTSMQNDLAAALRGLSTKETEYFQRVLGMTATDGYYNTIYEVHKGLRIGSTFRLVDPNLIKELIEHPVNGLNFKERIYRNTSRLASAVNEELRAGLLQGVSNDEMSLRLSKKTETADYVAQRLIRTEVTNTLNQATLRGYEESGVVDKYIYMATLDSNTTEVCTRLDERTQTEPIPIDEAVTGVNLPPMHVNCRSTTIPSFPDTMREARTRLARNNETGETFTVPADMTVKDYKDIYVNKTLTRAEWNKR